MGRFSPPGNIEGATRAKKKGRREGRNSWGLESPKRGVLHGFKTDGRGGGWWLGKKGKKEGGPSPEVHPALGEGLDQKNKQRRRCEGENGPYTGRGGGRRRNKGRGGSKRRRKNLSEHVQSALKGQRTADLKKEKIEDAGKKGGGVVGGNQSPALATNARRLVIKKSTRYSETSGRKRGIGPKIDIYHWGKGPSSKEKRLNGTWLEKKREGGE